MISTKKNSKILKIVSWINLFALYPIIILPSLTNCSKANHPDIDRSFLDLDPSGKIMGNFTYKDAIKIALSNQSSFTKFKEIFANEIILKWYRDRAKNNKTFANNLKQWKKEIDDQYNSLIQTLKDTHKDSWELYLQNKYLSVNGGTDESYIHKKLLEKVREEFINNVWNNDYFTLAKEVATDHPLVFSEVIPKIDFNTLNNPSNWEKINFYAQAKDGFKPNKANFKYFSSHLDGDYATIQQYVFDRWYATEKPFFVDLVSFNYSKQSSENKKFEYSENVNPQLSEEYPDFANFDKNHSNGNFNSSDYYVNFLDHYYKGDYSTSYVNNDKESVSNGICTFKINNITQAKDKKTLFFVCGSKVYNENSLSLPQSLAIGDLYNNLFEVEKKFSCLNMVPKSKIIDENGNILEKNLINNFITIGDNNNVDDGLPIATKGSDIPNDFIKIVQSSPTGDSNEVNDNQKKFIKSVSAFVVDDFSDKDGENKQPLSYGLDKNGAFILAIDGYPYVKNSQNKFLAMKNVFKYRLMQNKFNCLNNWLSDPHILGKNGKLEEYFKENFNNIILEMAISDYQNKDKNDFAIFKSCPFDKKFNKSFFKVISDEQRLNDKKNHLYEYIINTIEYDIYKNDLQNYNDANTKIYDYNSKYVQLAKYHNNEKFKDNNATKLGVKAPLPYLFQENNNEVNSHYDYFYNLKPIITSPNDSFVWNIHKEKFNPQLNHQNLCSILNNIVESAKYLVDHIKINNDQGFSPQINEAKQEKSNRFWLKSLIADSALYQMMSLTTNNEMIELLKIDTFQKYFKNLQNDNKELYHYLSNDKNLSNSILSVLTKYNLSTYSYDKYALENEKNYFSNLSNLIENYFSQQKSLSYNGYSDEKANLALTTLLATIAYLAKNNFEQFYKILNAKLSENEKAYLMYVSKYTYNSKNPREKDSIQENYGWVANIDNQLDNCHFHGINKKKGSFNDEPLKINENEMKISSPFLQNVIKKNFDGKSLEIAGFAGLVTKSNFKTILPNEISNILNDKLFNSLFNQIFCTKSHEYKNNISNNISDIKDTEIGDYGVLFPFAGCCDENGKEIKLESIKGIDPQLKDKLINKIKNNSPKLKLIKKILSITSFETLCELIASLNVSYAAESPFSNLNNKTLNGLKKQLIEAIIDVDDKHFSRLVNAQLNNSGKLEKFDYFFDVEGENECYQFMVTQINKEDLITKKLTPKFNHNEWIHGDAQIDPEEFFYLLVEMAMDPQVQKKAEHEIFKKVFANQKVKVYDASLYNTLGSKYIKKWSKKVLGE